MGIPQHRQDWAELLLLDQPRVIGNIAYDCRLYEVALTIEGFAASDNVAVLPRVFKEALYLLELGLVLEWSHLGSLLDPVVDDDLASQPPQFVADLPILGIMDVETLDSDAP